MRAANVIVVPLSGALTTPAKYLFLPLAGAPTVVEAIRELRSHDFSMLPFTLVGLVAIMVVGRIIFQLRKVGMTPTGILVGTGVRTIDIPFREIEVVSDSWLSNPRVVTVTSRGRRPVKFIGRWRGWNTGSDASAEALRAEVRRVRDER